MKSYKFRTNLKLLFFPIYQIKIENADAFKNSNTSNCLNFLSSQLFNHSIKSFCIKQAIPAFIDRLKLAEILLLTQSPTIIQNFLDFLSFNLPLCSKCTSTLNITKQTDTLNLESFEASKTNINILSINNISLSLSIKKLSFDPDGHRTLQERILKQYILNCLSIEFNNMNLSRNQDLIQTPNLVQVTGLKRDQIVDIDKWKVMITINKHILKVYIQPIKMFLKYYTETDALCNYKCLTWPNLTKAVVPEAENKPVNTNSVCCLEYYWMNKYNYSLVNTIKYFDVCFNLLKQDGKRAYFELSDSLIYPADCVFKEIKEEKIHDMEDEDWNRFERCLEGIKIGDEKLMISEKVMTKVQKSEGADLEL